MTIGADEAQKLRLEDWHKNAPELIMIFDTSVHELGQLSTLHYSDLLMKSYERANRHPVVLIYHMF